MKQNNGGPAFPAPLDTAMMAALTPSTGALGMSLRDYFAAKAMQSAIAGAEGIGSLREDQRKAAWFSVAQLSYEIADVMLAARDA